MTTDDIAARDFAKQLSEDELHDPEFLGRWFEKIDAFALSVDKRSQTVMTAREHSLLLADLTLLIEILATLFSARSTWAVGSDTGPVERINQTIGTAVGALNHSFPRLATWQEPAEESAS